MTGKFPATDFLSNPLRRFFTDGRLKAGKQNSPMVHRGPRPELVAQKGEFLVLMMSGTVRVFAEDEACFTLVQFQPAFLHPVLNRLEKPFSFLPRPTMHDGIVGITFEGNVGVMATHPEIEPVVQEKVC